MKIKFKHQPFQQDAVNSVVDCFEGQPYDTARFALDRGVLQAKPEQMSLGASPETERVASDAVGCSNMHIRLAEQEVLVRIRRVQRRNGILPSDRLDGAFNLTVEMETGTGKTYTYIKTMFELNRKYGWSKFIVVVPSIAIREGVLKTFQMTEDHFMEEYGKKARYFVYNSKQLHHLGSFAADASVSIMIINSQAFAARGKDARRIYAELDEFGSRRPIDVISEARPIVVIDEPQSVEGEKTKEALKAFSPLFTLRYSATHRRDYNKIYRLDALDAYNMKLVKKIHVKGIAIRGTSGTDSYLYVEGIELSAKQAPAARIEFEQRTKNGIRRITRKLYTGDDLYRLSGEMEQYRGYAIADINGANNAVTFINGVNLFAGDIRGDVNEAALRRIQIRETIRSHLEKERALYYRGIKVLSLFFIDEVAKYRRYGPDGEEQSGEYARMFEEEYAEAVREAGIIWPEEVEYLRYLDGIAVPATHKGYFSIDKKNKRFVDPKVPGKGTDADADSDDAEAYDLIMREKERLLGFAEPTRFLFTHSALKEGWDNPNVFQICTLKRNDSSIRKRQEVGRGLRLCVDKNGERIDAGVPGVDVHEVNVLTVVASESYESFAQGLQSEIAAALADRPKKADHDFIPVADDRRCNVKGQQPNDNFYKREFQELWRRINRGSSYTVAFDSEELVRKCVEALDRDLAVPGDRYRVEHGGMSRIESKEQLRRGEAFTMREAGTGSLQAGAAASSTRYDLIGKLMAETCLTRSTVVRMLTGVRPETFGLFRRNPEEFIVRSARIVNEQKAATVIECISYDLAEEAFDVDVFTGNSLSGAAGFGAYPIDKQIYDYLVADSKTERTFAQALDAEKEVSVFAKLPRGFFIPTPVGNYNPDWAISFREGGKKYVIFVAETKGGMESLELRLTEKAKVHCARKQLEQLSSSDLKYGVVGGYEELLKIMMQ